MKWTHISISLVSLLFSCLVHQTSTILNVHPIARVSSSVWLSESRSTCCKSWFSKHFPLQLSLVYAERLEEVSRAECSVKLSKRERESWLKGNQEANKSVQQTNQQLRDSLISFHHVEFPSGFSPIWRSCILKFPSRSLGFNFRPDTPPAEVTQRAFELSYLPPTQALENWQRKRSERTGAQNEGKHLIRERVHQVPWKSALLINQSIEHKPWPRTKADRFACLLVSPLLFSILWPDWGQDASLKASGSSLDSRSHETEWCTKHQLVESLVAT